MAKGFKYSLWRLYHWSCDYVEAQKVKDTNSECEVDKHLEAHHLNAASMYRREDELNAAHVDFFSDVE